MVPTRPPPIQPPATIHHPQFAVLAALVLLVALGLRLASWHAALGHDVRADELDYVIPAETLTRTGQYLDTFLTEHRTWTRVPLNALVLAAAFATQPPVPAGTTVADTALMTPRFAAGNLALIAVSLALLPLVMWLAAEAFPRRRARTALLAGGLTAIYPPLIHSAAQQLLSETLFITLMFATLVTLTRWQPRRTAWPWLVSTGLLLGLTALARPVAVAFLPFAALWICSVVGGRQYAVGSDEGLGGGGRGPDEGLGVGGRGLGNDARIADPTGPNPKSQIQNPKSAGPKSKIQNPKSAIARAAGGLLVTAAMLVAITPWTIYNYQAYGRLIFLDTANVTAFWHYNNYRGENETARIEALPNPADRQALILREGLANILGYPDRFLRNVANSLGYTWHLELQSAIQPNAWDLTQRDADVPEVLPGDALFLFVALAGLAGLAGLGGRGGWRPADQAGRVRRVLVFWIVCMGLLGAIIPYDARYRMPAAPALIIFAAGLLASADWRRVGDPRHWGRILRARPGVALLSAALGAWVIAGALGPRIPAAIQALTLAWQADHTDDPQSADRLNQAAIAALPSSFWPYRHAADSARQRGQDSAARRLYASARPRGEDPRDILGFADLVYRHPEWRLTPDEQHWLAADANGLRGWPWNSFAATPQTQLTLGGDRDWSYIQGFQGTERTAGMTFRWSTGVGQVRLPAPGAGPPATAVRLRLAAPAIGPPGAWPVTIQVAGAAPTHLDVIPGWADYTVRLEPAVRGAIDLEIISPLRNPRTYDPAARDNRRLGVGLAAVERLAAGP